MGTLAKVQAIEKPDLAAEAADALGATDDAGAEMPLVAALGSRSASVRNSVLMKPSTTSWSSASSSSPHSFDDVVAG